MGKNFLEVVGKSLDSHRSRWVYWNLWGGEKAHHGNLVKPAALWAEWLLCELSPLDGASVS